MTRAVTLACALALTGTPLAGCSDDGETTVTVLAAASLTEPFEELAVEFEEAHPDVDVRLAFDSSATLAQQALEGAPADVLATADEQTMEGAADALADPPRLFAGNRLTLVVPADDPAGVDGVEDLERPEVTWVACVETAPCGALARRQLDASGITAEPASLEVDVKAVLARVTSGEADAGFVYSSDAVAAGDRVRAVPLRQAPDGGTTLYPIAPLRQAGEPDLAREFVDLVLSPAGQAVLTDAGFTEALSSAAP